MQRHWFRKAFLPGGWAADVQINSHDGKIVSIENQVAPHPQALHHDIALPGMANLHSHAFQRAASGRTGRPGPKGDHFWSWRSQIYHLANSLTPEDLKTITALAYVEMLETGFTHVGEFHYLHHRQGGTPYASVSEMACRIIEAAVMTGVGLTLMPVFYAHSDIGGRAALPEQLRFICDLSLYAKLFSECEDLISRRPEVKLGIAPHSLRAVTPEQLDVLVDLGKSYPIHIHIAEQSKEVQSCQAVLGARPVRWLLDNQDINSRWCLVHATHMTSEETNALAKTGATVGLCPITEADLGDGLFPIEDYRRAGGIWGIGSDSNVLIDMALELRLLEYGQRLIHNRRNILCQPPNSVGQSLFCEALSGGANALGITNFGLQAGAEASFLTLNQDDPALAVLLEDDLFDGLIFSSKTLPIDQVWVRGKLMVDKGRHIKRDQIERDYKATLARLF